MVWDRLSGLVGRGEELSHRDRPESMPTLKEVDRARAWSEKPTSPTNVPPQPVEIAATAVQARLESACSTASAQEARFSCLNLVHSLQSEEFLYRTISLWTFWTPPSAMTRRKVSLKAVLEARIRNCHKSSSGRSAARLVTLGNVLSSMTTELAPVLSYSPMAWMTLIALP